MGKLQSVVNRYQTLIALKSTHFKANGKLAVVLLYGGDRSIHFNYHRLYGCRTLLKRWQKLCRFSRLQAAIVSGYSRQIAPGLSPCVCVGLLLAAVREAWLKSYQYHEKG